MIPRERAPTRIGPMKGVLMLGATGLMVAGADSLFDLGIMDNFIEAKGRTEVKATPPKILKIIQNQRICVTDTEAENYMDGKMYVDMKGGIGPLKATKSYKVIDIGLHNVGDFATCTKPEDVVMTASIHPTDPAQSKLNVTINKMYADRPRITNKGQPSSIVRGGLTRWGRLANVNLALMTGQMQTISEGILAQGLCDGAVVTAAQQGFTEFYQGVGESLGIPKPNLSSNVYINYETLPAFVDDPRDSKGKERLSEARAIKSEETMQPLLKSLKNSGMHIDVTGINCGTAEVKMDPEQPAPADAVSIQEQL